MKRQHYNYKPKCLKHALNKQEIDAINTLLSSLDPESRSLGRELVLTSKVFKHYKNHFNMYRRSDGSYAVAYYGLLRDLSK